MISHTEQEKSRQNKDRIKWVELSVVDKTLGKEPLHATPKSQSTPELKNEVNKSNIAKSVHRKRLEACNEKLEPIIAIQTPN